MARPTKEGLFKQAGSPIWYCRWHDNNGILQRKSTGKTDVIEATQVYNQLRLTTHCQPDAATIITVRTILDVYHQYRGYELKGRAYKAGRKVLETFFYNTPWTELGERGESKRNIRNYIAYRRNRSVKNSSINREIGILSAAANVAIEAGVDIKNYAIGQRLPVPRNQYYWLTREQASIFTEAAKPRKSFKNSSHLYDYCRIAFGTGMRMSEILTLTIQHVSLEHNVIRLPTSKSAEPHEIPMNESVRAAVVQCLTRAAQNQSIYLFANPKTKQPIKSIITPFKRAAIRANIPVTDKKIGQVGFRVHDTRHSVGSWLVQEGTPLEAVQDLLNHSDIRTTQRYAHHAPDARKAIVNKLPKF